MANGRLPASDLKAIAGGRLEKRAAAGWNTMRLYIWDVYKIDIRPGGPRSSYRTYQEQVYFWNLYRSGRGNLAAYPGTSNHGWGKAVDLAAYSMRTAIDRVGRTFGWRKVEAPSEWWHVNYVGGFNRPNPGPSLRYPVMRRGSSGAGQAKYVRQIQRRLRRHLRTKKIKVDGHFGLLTKRSVKRFQRMKGLKADGIVGRKTWRALRKQRAPRRRRR